MFLYLPILLSPLHGALEGLSKKPTVAFSNGRAREVQQAQRVPFLLCLLLTHLQKEKSSREVRKLRHKSATTPFHGCWWQRWVPLLPVCPAAHTRRSNEEPGQWRLVSSQIKAWSGSCRSHEGLLAGSVPERGLRKFSANVIAFLICMKNK